MKFRPITSVVCSMMELRRSGSISSSSEVTKLYAGTEIDPLEERCFQIADRYAVEFEQDGFQVHALSGRRVEIFLFAERVGFLDFRERLTRGKELDGRHGLRRTPFVAIERLVTLSEPADDLLASIPKAIKRARMALSVRKLNREQRLASMAAVQAEQFLSAHRSDIQNRLGATLTAFRRMSAQMEEAKRARALVAEFERYGTDDDALTIEILKGFVKREDADQATVLRALTAILRGHR